MDQSNVSTLDELQIKKFEARWLEGRPERIEGCLPDENDPRYVATLEALVRMELEFSWKGFRGGEVDTVSTRDQTLTKPPVVEDYLSRFPELNKSEIVLRLLQKEYLVRHRYGDHPNADELACRFPAAVRSSSQLEQALPKDLQGARPLGPGPGSNIGPYKILQRIGEGAFGTVYMAEQEEPVRRRVALKIIKAGMDTREVIARFEAERQALAIMDHTNIARVLDAGATETGLPYFAMELIKGVPITEYCDQNKLSVSERLDLFIQVCLGVQHAHQKGVIHRDLKPSNVLVALNDGRPVPKVIDFGVAKATQQRLTDRTVFTQYGQVIGTPQYMSPEQAEVNQLDIDTRSDVYSLGVLLYELLTGSTPIQREQLRGAALDELLRLIRETEAPKPSTRITVSDHSTLTISAQRKTEPRKLGTLIRGELDWIVMKALEKDRTRRYESAGAFAADLRRHLDHEPVEAGPPSAAYKLRKFARKHRRMIAGGLAFAAILIVATVISLWQAIRATEAERKAKSDRARAVKAEKNERRARIHVEDVKEDTYVFLEAARTAADEWLIGLSGDLLYYPGLNPTRERLLREAERHYKTFSSRTSDDPKLMLEYGRATVRLGDVQRLLDKHADAKESYSAAEATFERLLEQHPDDRDVQLELANSRLGLGLVLATSADTHNQAERAFLSALAIIERLLAEEPKNADYRNARGRCVLALSELLVGTGQEERREKLVRESIALFEQLARDSDNPKYRSRLMEAMFQLAAVLQDEARSEEAVTLLQTAIRAYDKVVARNKTRPDLYAGRGECRLALANAMRQLSRYQQAFDAHDAAIADFESAARLIAAPLDAQRYQKIIGQEYDRLAELANHLGSNADAKRLSIEAMKVFISLVNDKPNDPERVFLKSRSQTRLAEVLGELGEDSLAEQHFQEAISEYRELREFYADELRYREHFAICLRRYARLLERMTRTADAKRCYENAIGHLEAVAQADPENEGCRHELASCYAQYGDLFRADGDEQQATSLYDKAIALRGELHHNAASDYELALLLASAVGTPVHNPQRALALSRQLLEARPNDAEYHHLLGVCYYRTGEWENAVDALQKAVEARLIDNSFDWFYIAMAYQHLERSEQARETYDRAVRAMDEQRIGNLRLHRLRAEAAQLLELSPSSAPSE